LLGDTESQKRDYDTAIKLDPKDSEYYLYRARFYEKQGKAELAKADRDKAKKLHCLMHPFLEYQLKQ
jgi:Tfp pilus assembly protein PilF